MRKSFWIMLAVMVAAVSAPNARADSFTYTYTTPGLFSWTTAAIPGVTMMTTVPAADLTATSNTGTVTGCATSSVILDALGSGEIFTNFSGCSHGGSDDFVGFALSDYITPGTYVNSLGRELVVTAAVGTPEPSSVALMLLGVGLVVVLLRKRNSRGHQMAM